MRRIDFFFFFTETDVVNCAAGNFIQMYGKKLDKIEFATM